MDIYVVQGRKNHCIAVIGDGAITGGMAYEAMNHAGFLDKNMIVILNDNQQVSPFSCCRTCTVELLSEVYISQNRNNLWCWTFPWA